MTSILDLPPELIIVILGHLGEPDKPSIPSAGVPVEYCLRGMNGVQRLCPCSDKDKIVDQLLTTAGRYFGKAARRMQRDVVQFGTSHPYFMNCIDQSGYCEMVDASASDSGIVLRNTMSIPFAVRQVHRDEERQPPF
jgi:hypothetical protein